MMKYKPKPTRYYKMFGRARVEARWGVFYDGIKLPYIHEKADTYLEALNKRYLPDFYHQSLGGELLTEIKGGKPTWLEQEKCEILVAQKEVPMVLINGSPFHQDYEATAYYVDYDLYQCWFCGRVFGIPYCEDCDNCQVIEWYEPSKTVNKMAVRFEERTNEAGYKTIYIGGMPLSNPEKDLFTAFKWASHARFEYTQNDISELFKFEYLLFNPAYQVQDLKPQELLYEINTGISIGVCEMLIHYNPYFLRQLAEQYDKNMRWIISGGTRTFRWLLNHVIENYCYINLNELDDIDTSDRDERYYLAKEMYLCLIKLTRLFLDNCPLIFENYAQIEWSVKTYSTLYFVIGHIADIARGYIIRYDAQ